MKAESTIRREIQRLKAISENEAAGDRKRGEAYEAYHALRWVIGDLDTSPARLLAVCHSDKP